MSFGHLEVIVPFTKTRNGAQIIHNMATGLFYMGCAATTICRNHFESLHTDREREGYVKCNKCGSDYSNPGAKTVLGTSVINGDYQSTAVLTWLAVWMGVPIEEIGVSVENKYEF